jgi:flagellar protein FlbD
LIKVTRLTGKTFFINAEKIEFVESTPDTVITLESGKKIIVSEKADIIIDLIADYHRLVGKSLYSLVLNRIIEKSGEKDGG